MSRYFNRTAKGLCGNCGKSYSGSFRCCEQCRTKHNIIVRRRRLVKKSIGLCKYCNRPRYRGHFCIVCWEKQGQKQRERDYFKRYGHEWYKLKTLYLNQDRKCAISGVPILVEGDNINATIDHIIPKCKGGSNDLINLQWVHHEVNELKGRISLEKFLDWCHIICDHRTSLWMRQ